ncbi:alginate lyase family protein [Virgibacillus senegalensis]|uniref:alginate lyase family protein n=1 Tax=Virgibacillus senegalensis TaxID=1499679 RepID=UPI00069FDDB3|nr:alginate lyase family protein [Virgibacillus senegalensis]
MGKMKGCFLIILVFTIAVLWSPALTAMAKTAEKTDQKVFTSHFDGVLFNQEMLELMKQRIEKKEEPTYTAWLDVKAAADYRMEQEPHAPKNWYVPGFYTDPEAHRAAKATVMNDANGAYELALAYQMTGEEAYAAKAASFINDWSTTVKTLDRTDDSMLSFSYHFPAMIYAADLIRDSSSWENDDQAMFEAFLREKALPMNTMGAENNWGNWGLVLFLSTAAYLGDEGLFDQGIDRWKEFIETQIDENGHLKHEVNRNGGTHGIWYSHFSLQPQTIAAEIARINGVYLYDYISPSGHSLEQAYDEVVNWVAAPETFPYYDGPVENIVHVTHIRDDAYLNFQGEYPASMGYFEILNNVYENDQAEELLHELRPLNSVHSVPHPTFTHGDLGAANSEEIARAKISIDKEELVEGETRQLHVEAYDEHGFLVDPEEYNIVFFSDNKSVAKVKNKTGMVSAKGEGEASIYAKVIRKGKGKPIESNSLKVMVYKPEITVEQESITETVHFLPHYIGGTSKGIEELEIRLGDTSSRIAVEENGNWHYRLSGVQDGDHEIELIGKNSDGKEIVSERVVVSVLVNDYLFEETFENLSEWQTVEGNWEIVEDGGNTKAKAEPSSWGWGPALAFVKEKTWDDFVIQARFSQISGSSTYGGSSGLLFRYQDEQNFYHLRLEYADGENQYLQLYKWVNGSATKLAEEKVSFQQDQWYDMRAVVDGDSITGYFNGELLIDVQDTSFSYGKIGLRGYHRSMYVDDLSVFEK